MVDLTSRVYIDLQSIINGSTCSNAPELRTSRMSSCSRPPKRLSDAQRCAAHRGASAPLRHRQTAHAMIRFQALPILRWKKSERAAGGFGSPIDQRGSGRVECGLQRKNVLNVWKLIKKIPYRDALMIKEIKRSSR